MEKKIDSNDLLQNETKISEMTEFERLNIKKMISEGNVEDNTTNIQNLKHSTPIAQDILQIKYLKQNFPNMTTEQFTELCIEKCNFLYNNYTDIFHKMVRDELDVNIFSQFLYVLKQVEDGKLNYHDASFTIGKLLKEMYVDSAMRRSSNSDKNVEEHKYVTPKNISWKDYKKDTKI